MRKITDEQLNIINRFSCERISTDTHSLDLIQRFENKRGEPIVNHLKTRAWKEDSEGEAANYLVKAENGEAALYFSLKCGSLFSPFDEDGFLKQTDLIKGLLNDIKVMNDPHKKRFLLEALRNHREFADMLAKDKVREEGSSNIRVENTYPGIEIVNFCSNDLIKAHL